MGTTTLNPMIESCDLERGDRAHWWRDGICLLLVHGADVDAHGGNIDCRLQQQRDKRWRQEAEGDTVDALLRGIESVERLRVVCKRNAVDSRSFFMPPYYLVAGRLFPLRVFSFTSSVILSANRALVLFPSCFHIQ